MSSIVTSDLVTSDLVVSELNVFPLKSAMPIAVQSVQLDNRGPENDRRWMIINNEGEFVTQRQYPRMCLIETLLDSGGKLLLNAGGMPSLNIVQPEEPRNRWVQVWNDKVEAQDCGEEAAGWVSEFLGEQCRIVFMPESTRRRVDPDYATNNEIVSFSDGFPLLLISQASLDAFNTHLEVPIVMNRFRPNIVIQGCEAFAEDEWELIVIGDIEFQVAKPCSRCVIPSIDPVSGEKQPEVVRALAKHRRREGKVYFGQNLIHHSQGKIAVNDAVQVVR